jgi:murein DD-endopeptidase MepM/ murein hydrolase activator NlpD
MPRFNVPSCLRVWPRVALFALVGIAVAGCADSARFDSNPYASNDRPAPAYTGSVSNRAPANRVDAQPLPPPQPSRPATVATRSGGVANGGQGFGAYRPAYNSTQFTGSVPARKSPPPQGHWSWDGGKPVIVGSGETIETIARKHGVPSSAIMQANGIRDANTIRPGQRIVIPHYISATAHREAPPAQRAAAPMRHAESVHIVEPGETLLGIAHRSGVTLVALAHANNIQPYAKVGIGDRLTIPGGRKVAERKVAAQKPAAPRIEKPHTVPVAKVAAAPVEKARVATPEPHATESVAKTEHVASAMPSFRWPVKGRVIAGFGKRPNGTQNDGINLAVPEGTPIKAAEEGVVAYAGNELKGYGNLVLIRHGDGFVSAYANASELLVKRGDTIKRGQVIAHAGQTGNVTSPQLHFEIRKGSTPVDPAKYLNGA